MTLGDGAVLPLSVTHLRGPLFALFLATRIATGKRT